MKYTQARVNKILELYSSGLHSVPEICNKVGITKDIFYKWRRTREDFSAKLIEADSVKLESIKDLAISSLAKKIQGMEWIEVTKVDGKVVKEVTKFIPPSDGLIQFVIDRTAPKFDKKETKGPQQLPPVIEMELDGCDKQDE